MNATVLSDAAGTVDSVLGIPAIAVALNISNAIPIIAGTISNVTAVTMENYSTVEGGEMLVERGLIQRLTDPFDFQQPWTALVYFIGDLYIFNCLHLVVHSRFSLAMEKIVELSGMNEDVAGATLMAIGTSLPEVLCGVIGVFVPGAGEAGLGTVVGSLIFNMLVITGACIALFPKAHLMLSRSATVRDIIFQVIVILMLLWAFSNQQADPSNVVMFLLLYVVYIMVCANSGTIAHTCLCDEAHNTPSDDEDKFAPLAQSDSSDKSSYSEEESLCTDAEDETKTSSKELLLQSEGEHAHESLDRHWPPPTDPVGFLTWILWIPLIIVEALVVFTIPDIMSPTWQKCLKFGLAVNLLTSAVWLGTLVLFMISWATKAGELVGIAPAVMGLTFCAAGTSVPDCLVSIIVAKQGKGNMAISNVFGSNVFDILIAMAVPWALRYAVFGTENKIKMEAEGFGSAICILALVMLFYISCVCYYNFKLPRKVGYLHLILYVVFLIYVFATNMTVFHEEPPEQ